MFGNLESIKYTTGMYFNRTMHFNQLPSTTPENTLLLLPHPKPENARWSWPSFSKFTYSKHVAKSP